MDIQNNGSESLYKKLEAATKIGEINECINSNDADVRILKLAVRKSANFYSFEVKDTVKSIIKSPKANEEVLEEVIKVYSHSLWEKPRGNISYVISLAIIGEVVSSPKVTSNILVSILNRYPLSGVIVRSVIVSPKADGEVLKAAINRLTDGGVVESTEERVNLLKLIISNSSVTSEMLVSILEKSCLTLEVFISVINSSKFDASVFLKAQSILHEINYPARQRLCEEMAKKKLEVIGKESGEISHTIAPDKAQSGTLIDMEKIKTVMCSKNISDDNMGLQFDMEDFVLWALQTNSQTGRLNIHPVLLSFFIFLMQLVFHWEWMQEYGMLSDFEAFKKFSGTMYALEALDGSLNNIERYMNAPKIKDMSRYFKGYLTRPSLEIAKIESGMYTAYNFLTVDDKIYALGFLISADSLDVDKAKEFIETCLGSVYLDIYIEMKKQRDAVLSKLSRDGKPKR